MNRLSGKVAIITGADGGICHKASELFCAEGAKVVMVDIDPAVEEKCSAITAGGGDAVAIVADVSQPVSWKRRWRNMGRWTSASTARPASPCRGIGTHTPWRTSA